jgi:hypothetical protein
MYVLTLQVDAFSQPENLAEDDIVRPVSVTTYSNITRLPGRMALREF